MTQANSGKLNQTVQQIVERIARSQQLTRQDYLHLAKELLSDSGLQEERNRQINAVLDALRLGDLQIVDW